MGQLHSRQAFPDKQVKMIQSAGFDLDKHLVFAKLRVRDIFELQHLRPAKFVDAYSLHQLSPCKLAKITHFTTETRRHGEKQKDSPPWMQRGRAATKTINDNGAQPPGSPLCAAFAHNGVESPSAATEESLQADKILSNRNAREGFTATDAKDAKGNPCV